MKKSEKKKNLRGSPPATIEESKEKTGLLAPNGLQKCEGSEKKQSSRLSNDADGCLLKKSEKKKSEKKKGLRRVRRREVCLPRIG